MILGTYDSHVEYENDTSKLIRAKFYQTAGNAAHETGK